MFYTSLIFWLSVLGLCVINMIKLFSMHSGLTGELILRVIGVFIWPVGAVMGLI